MMVGDHGYLRIVHGWDTFSACWARAPAPWRKVIALSTELGGDLRAIAIVQTMRVLLLVVGLPNGLALFGLVVPAMPVAARTGRSRRARRDDRCWSRSSTAFAVAFLRLRFPGGLLFGAMAGSAHAARHRLHSCGAAVVDRQLVR